MFLRLTLVSFAVLTVKVFANEDTDHLSCDFTKYHTVPCYYFVIDTGDNGWDFNDHGMFPKNKIAQFWWNHIMYYNTPYCLKVVYKIGGNASFEIAADSQGDAEWKVHGNGIHKPKWKKAYVDVIYYGYGTLWGTMLRDSLDDFFELKKIKAFEGKCADLELEPEDEF